MVDSETREWLNKIEKKLDNALEDTARHDERIKTLESGQRNLAWWVRFTVGAVITAILGACSRLWAR
jgi:flagellar motility protein MotE (MotC chaperone)